MRNLKTAREVVELLGGVDAVCKMTGATRKSAYHWTGQTGTFPARAHDIMLKALNKKGYTAPAALWNQIEAA